jgi:hypothetical protein
MWHVCRPSTRMCLRWNRNGLYRQGTGNPAGALYISIFVEDITLDGPTGRIFQGNVASVPTG